MNQIKHVNLVRSIAWTFCKTTRIDWKELFSEACLAYCEAVRSYNPEKAAETTWIYHCVKGALITFCQKEMKRKVVDGIDWHSSVFDPQDVDQVEVKIKVSPDTKDILDMVASNPQRYQCAPKIAIGRIRQDLKVLGRVEKKRLWSWTEVDDAVRNMKVEILP